jgi:hypothetical protein
MFEPLLRSGLYIVRSPVKNGVDQLFVIYWPEDTTWNDNAATSVCRNRVTFMRFVSSHSYPVSPENERT